MNAHTGLSGSLGELWPANIQYIIYNIYVVRLLYMYLLPTCLGTLYYIIIKYIKYCWSEEEKCVNNINNNNNNHVDNGLKNIIFLFFRHDTYFAATNIVYVYIYIYNNMITMQFVRARPLSIK